MQPQYEDHRALALARIRRSLVSLDLAVLVSLGCSPLVKPRPPGPAQIRVREQDPRQLYSQGTLVHGRQHSALQLRGSVNMIISGGCPDYFESGPLTSGFVSWHPGGS